MTLSIIAIILSVLGLIFVWLLKNIVQSDMNGLRDQMKAGDINALLAIQRRIAEELVHVEPAGASAYAKSLVSHIRETIALMDPPVHGFRIACHRKRYYIEAVRFHDQGGAAFHTELDHEFESYQDADAVVKALLEARSSHKKIVYSPVMVPKDDVC